MMRTTRRAVLALALGVALSGCQLVPRHPGPPPRAQAPSFTLPSHRGESVALASLLERGPVVVVFYRGFW